jgi:hypothetical protein
VSAPAKGQLVPVPDDDTAPAPAAAARPRQVTRPVVLGFGSVVTAFLAWRFATGHDPGRTLEGHVFWFALWDVILTVLLVWAVTGFRHRRYRERIGRNYGRARTAGGTWYSERRDQLTDWRDRPRGPGPATQDPGPDPGEPTPVSRLAPGRGRGRRRPAQPAPGGRTGAPPEWRAAAAQLADADGDSGQEVIARVAGAAAGCGLVSGAVEDLHHHVTVDRGYDERAMPSLGAAADAFGEAKAQLETALREVAEFYGHLFDAADEGKRGPHDGHEFEE